MLMIIRNIYYVRAISQSGITRFFHYSHRLFVMAERRCTVALCFPRGLENHSFQVGCAWYWPVHCMHWFSPNGAASIAFVNHHGVHGKSPRTNTPLKQHQGLLNVRVMHQFACNGASHLTAALEWFIHEWNTGKKRRFSILLSDYFKEANIDDTVEYVVAYF